MVSLVLIAIFLPYGTNLILKAKADTQPLNVSISNLTDVSFTISWETQAVIEGFILYGTDLANLDKAAYDNNAGSFGESFKTSNHVVTLTSLFPITLYYYKIVSGGKIYSGARKHIFEPIKTLIYSPQTNGAIRGYTTKNNPSLFYQLFSKQ